jgi:2-polyprenyl-3-methyl-5-hydroxy-6-metoxy-1,4-benzoquinol methylase
MIYKKLDIDSLDRGIAILDMGCGVGTFLSILREKGFNNLCGWEPQIDLVNQKQDNAVKIGDCLENIQSLESSQYDVIFIIGVLHHLGSLEDIKKCIDNIHFLLKAGGLFISVEPHKTILRSIATWLMFKLPVWILPSNVKLDKALYEHEINEVEQWLNYQVKCDQMILQGGPFAKQRTMNCRGPA